jgi:2'-5' RNA ligase
MPRAFIAVRIDPPPALLEPMKTLARFPGPVKAVEPKNLHITLRFLGETDEALLATIAEKIRESAQGVAPFDLTFTGLGAFPHIDRPSVIWAGTRDDEPLHRIVDELNPRIDALNIGGDKREWDAHLTLARVKAKPPAEVAAMLRRMRQRSFGSVRIGSIELLGSELTPAGPIYSVLSTVPLT